MTTVPGPPEAGDSDTATTGSNGGGVGLGSRLPGGSPSGGSLRGGSVTDGPESKICSSTSVCGPAARGPSRTHPEIRPSSDWVNPDGAGEHAVAVRRGAAASPVPAAPTHPASTTVVSTPAVIRENAISLQLRGGPPM